VVRVHLRGLGHELDALAEGSFTRQWLVSWQVIRILSTLDMKFEKCSKFDQRL
jgi:hypothetical protein